MCSQKVVKIYEPNETINMLGVRFEIKNNCVRFFTAHLKQCSVNTRDVIQDQFEEIKSQFKQASVCKEAMLLVFDANVHVGGEGIKNCQDTEDWGGKMLMDMVNNENLTLVNNLDLCKGIVTRIDPRYGTCTTLDLAICNAVMKDKLCEMVIDEAGIWRPTKYASDN